LPVHPRTAPRHNAPLLRPFDFAYTAIFNALRVPVTVAPVGRDADGLPVAVQLVAVRGADAVTIGGASLLEQALGGWTACSL
jgi:fatty acid amide hydrolase 2